MAGQQDIAQLFFGTGGLRQVQDTVFGVEKMKSFLNAYGVQHTNLFRVTIPIPGTEFNFLNYVRDNNGLMPPASIATIDPTTKSRVLQFYCTDINLPGVSFATSEVRRYGYGPYKRKPYTPIFADSTFTFLGDGQGIIHQHFLDWMRKIINYSVGSGAMAGTAGTSSRSGMLAYEVEYEKYYSVNAIQIEVFDKAQGLSGLYYLYDAYPINIGEIALSQSSQDEIMRIPVVFTFRDFEMFTTKNSGINYAYNTYGNLGRTGEGTQTLGQAAYQFGQNIGDIISNGAAGLFTGR